MAADNYIMEALARIERKQDYILEIVCKFAGVTELPQISEPMACVVCKQQISYDVDINEGVVLRKCGCKTGKIALNIGAFAPPTPTTKKDQDNEQRTNEEDRLDSTRRRGPAGRR